MTAPTTHRQILRSTSIIGGSSLVNIIVGLARLKLASLILGPAGVGVIGLLQNLVASATAIAGFGMGAAGTRQIAEAAGLEDIAAEAAARRAVAWAASATALLGGGLFWLLRRPLAVWVVGDARRAGDLGWIALAVAASVAAAAPTAILNGLRRIGDLAWISIWSSLVASVLGVGFLAAFGDRALIGYVLAAPLTSLAFALAYLARLRRTAGPATPLRDLARQWTQLLRLGVSIMLASLAGSIAQLAVSSLIEHRLGAAPLGQFQAAFTISMTYVGFILAAMGTDYYPRLTASVHDRAAANRMVNEQTEVAILLASPIFLAVIAAAPWIVPLLYSSRFADAVLVLRWQILADILKLASWPMGFLVLAIGNGGAFLALECLSAVTLTGTAFLLIPRVGLQASGIAYLVMYLIYAIVAYAYVGVRTGFRWSRIVAGEVLLVLALAISVVLAARASVVAALALGLGSAAIMALLAVWRLRSAGASESGA